MERIDDIIYSIAYEKNLNIEKVRESLKESLLQMAQETISENFEYIVYLDDKSKTISLCKKIFAVESEGELEMGTINIKEAKDIDDSIVVGDFLEEEIDLNTLRRSSSNFLFLSIEKKLQKLLEEELYEKFNKQVGQIVHATVLRVDNDENTITEIGEVKGILPLRNRIKGEKFKVGDTFSAILNYVNTTHYGIHLELSRTTPKFLNELLHLEVPELKEGQLEIMGSARIPGVRAKIAIQSYSEQIDPIGSIVGTKGVRIKAVSSVLNGENIDCIEFSDKPEIFIARALSPAIISSVVVIEDEKKALVKLHSEQKKKAIGSNGFNIRLASVLTGYQIELVEQEASILGEAPIEPANNNSSLEGLFE